jgi:predicted RNA-binding Zn-ribbon protein involved in translation (DUF1610 family)
MSDGIDIEIVRAHYRNMSDDELIRAVTTDIYGLTPAAFEVVNAEITRRKLGENINNAIEAQTRELTLEEIDAYCALIRELPCPVCGKSDVKLNGTVVTEVVSPVFVSQSHTEIKVACPDCLDKTIERAVRITLLFGLWTFFGMAKSADAIRSNRRSKSAHRNQEPNNALRSFVCSSIGEIEAHKQNREKLRVLIS